VLRCSPCISDLVQRGVCLHFGFPFVFSLLNLRASLALDKFSEIVCQLDVIEKNPSPHPPFFLEDDFIGRLTSTPASPLAQTALVEWVHKPRGPEPFPQ
jgi:hypothetical protein